jgi:phosphate-selective porin OprO/OprP
MRRFARIAVGTLFLATLIPTSLGAAEGGALSLEERIKRIEEALGLDNIPSEAVANGPISGGNSLVQAPATRPTANIGTSLTQAQRPQGSIPTSVPTAPAIAPRSNDPVWSFANSRPTIRSADGQFELAIRGRFQYDAGSFFQSRDLPASVTTGRDLHNGSHFRRAQLGIEGTAFGDFDYEFAFEYGSSGTERPGQILRLRLAYTGIPNFIINAGAIQPRFTLDDSTSSGDLTFIERSSIANTILDPFGGSDSRRGIEVRFQKQGVMRNGDNLMIATAFTGERIAIAKTDDEGTQILGRLAYRFYSDQKSNFQIGASASYILNEPDKMMAFHDRPESRIDGTRLVGFGRTGLPASVGSKSATLIGVEGAMNYGPLTMQGEFYRYRLSRTDSALRDPSFKGWYLQGSYILTGEMRPYNAGRAAFGTPSPRNPFRAGPNAWGAWEIKARYSVNDLNAFAFDANPANRVRGGEQRIISTGLNWYVNRNVRWLFDYSFVDVNRLDAAGLPAGQDFNVLSGRMQFTF